MTVKIFKVTLVALRMSIDAEKEHDGDVFMDHRSLVHDNADPDEKRELDVGIFIDIYVFLAITQ